MYNPNRELLESVKNDLLKYSTPDFISNFPHIINEIKEKNDKFKNCDGIVKDALYDYIKNQKYQFELRDKKPPKPAKPFKSDKPIKPAKQDKPVKIQIQNIKKPKVVIDKKYKTIYRNIKKNTTVELKQDNKPHIENNKTIDVEKQPTTDNQSEPNNPPLKQTNKNIHIEKPNENITDDIDLKATALNLFAQINTGAMLINKVITRDIITTENEAFSQNIINDLKRYNMQLTDPIQKLSIVEIDYINAKIKALSGVYKLHNSITKADKLENISNIAKANESASRSFAVLLQASNMQEEKQMQIDNLKKLENIDNGTIDDINDKINELLTSNE